MSDRLGRLQAALTRIVDDDLTAGIQLAVRGPEGAASVAVGVDGLGREVRNDQLVALLCVTKLITSSVALRLADFQELDLSAPVAEFVPEVGPEIGSVPLWDLLTHQSGCWGERASQLMHMSSIDSLKAFGPRRRRRPFEGIYGEYVGYHILGIAIERSCNVGLGDLVERLLVAPAESAPIALRRPFNADDVAVSYSLSSGRRLPWIAELLDDLSIDGSPANGAYGSAAAVVDVLRFVVGKASDSASLLSCLTQQCTRSGYDPVLKRSGAYSAGAWWNLRDHEFGRRVSPRSFGLAGLGGAAVALVDLNYGLYLSWRDLRVHEDRASLFAVRARVLDAVYSWATD